MSDSVKSILRVRRLAKILLDRIYEDRPAPCERDFEREVDDLTTDIMIAVNSDKQDKGN